MTRLCMDCGTFLGEKCPFCGNEAEQVPHTDPIKIWQCRNARCRYFRGSRIFFAGAGGLTHGLCATCVNKRNDVAERCRRTGAKLPE